VLTARYGLIVSTRAIDVVTVITAVLLCLSQTILLPASRKKARIRRYKCVCMWQIPYLNNRCSEVQFTSLLTLYLFLDLFKNAFSTTYLLGLECRMRTLQLIIGYKKGFVTYFKVFDYFLRFYLTKFPMAQNI
jgi:hypothetical protein